MVDYAYTARASFDSSHRVPGYPGCDYPHGHTWNVAVTVTGALEPDENDIRRVNLSEDIVYDLTLVIDEIDGRDLDAMLPGISTIPEGVAAWILERLPVADQVEVEMGWRRVTGLARRNKKR